MMDNSVVITLITAMQAVIIALFSFLSKRVSKVSKDVAATRYQVVNDHPQSPNMREENDKRHREIRTWFKLFGKRLDNQDRKLDSLEVTVHELTEGFFDNRERIEDIESTFNPSKDKK